MKLEGEEVRKKILIYAYTNINLGDDLFIKILCERYPNADFLLIASHQYKTIFKSINNLTVKSNYLYPIAIKLQNLLHLKSSKIVQSLKKREESKNRRLSESAETGVYIGGSIYIQQDSW